MQNMMPRHQAHVVENSVSHPHGDTTSEDSQPEEHETNLIEYNGSHPNTWLFDSGANTHLLGQRSAFSSLGPVRLVSRLPPAPKFQSREKVVLHSRRIKR